MLMRPAYFASFAYAAALATTSLQAQPPIVRLPAQAAAQQQRTVIAPAILQKIKSSNASTTDVVQPVETPPSSTATTGSAHETQKPNNEKVSVDLAEVSAKLKGIGGAAIFDDGGSKQLSKATQNVDLEEGAILSIRSRNPVPMRAVENGAVQTASPTVLYTTDDGGITRSLALVYRSQGLTWSPAKHLFAGSLLVGIIDREHPMAQAKIPTPIPVQLLPHGDGLEPDEFSIDQIGGRFFPVRIASEDPDDPYRIRLVSPVDPDLPEASLPLHRLAVVLAASPLIDGLGIGSTDVTVRARAGRLNKGEPVTIKYDNGHLEKQTVTVEDDGTATTKLHSTGLGVATLSVDAGPYYADPVKVKFAFPILLIACACLGAMLGAGIFVYALIRSGRNPKRNYFVDWLVGFTVGIGATAMAYAGMKLPDLVPMPKAFVGALVPFALAFVCAAMGTALINYLTGLRQPGPSPSMKR